MFERVDAFCICGHKVFDYDPNYNFSGFVTCSECDTVSHIHELTHVKRELTQEEKEYKLRNERLNYPFYGGRLL